MGAGGFLAASLDDVNVVGSALTSTQVNQLYLNSVGQLPAATPVSIAAGATLDLGGTSQTVVSLSDVAGVGGTITNGAAGAATLNLAPTTTTTFSGTIQDGSGTVRLAISGAGTQILAGANNYSGGTTLSGGVLRVANASGSATGSGNVTLNFGTLASGNGSGGNGGSGSPTPILAGSGPHTIAPGGIGTTGTLHGRRRDHQQFQHDVQFRSGIATVSGGSYKSGDLVQ